VPLESKSSAKRNSFAEEDTWRINHDDKGIIGFKWSNEFFIENLRHVVSSSIVQSEVGEFDGHFLWNVLAKIQNDKCLAAGRQDRPSPELHKALL